MLFLNCASCSILKESNTFCWPAKSMNKKRLLLAEVCASVLKRKEGGGEGIKDERSGDGGGKKTVLELFCLSCKREHGYTLIDSPVVICSANHSAACFMGKHTQACIQSSPALADMMPPADMATNHNSCSTKSQL